MRNFVAVVKLLSMYKMDRSFKFLEKNKYLRIITNALNQTSLPIKKAEIACSRNLAACASGQLHSDTDQLTGKTQTSCPHRCREPVIVQLSRVGWSIITERLAFGRGVCA